MMFKVSLKFNQIKNLKKINRGELRKLLRISHPNF